MKPQKLALALAIFAAGSAPAFAQSTDWTGLYLGASVGHADGDSDVTTTVFDADDGYFASSSVTAIDAAGDGRIDPSGSAFGATLGYNWQSDALVFGLEGDWSALNVDDNRTVTATYPCCAPTGFGIYQQTSAEDLVTLRARIGFATNRSLFYFTAGWAQVDLDIEDAFADDYDDARIPIGMLPGAAGTLTSNIDGIPNPASTALTPTSVAVQGGITYAKAYKAQNPGHAVVLVLATDGLPTRCSPYESSAIAALAAAGLPDVKTFVVGVFSPNEQATAKPNLDNIAKGGGTNEAFIVSTSGNVTADFQKAMDQIRGAALPCDYNVPKPQSGTPDYGRVNVKFTKGDGTASVFPQSKTGAAGCDAGGGWYYDVDPASGTPTKITLCPASCDAVKASGAGSKVDVLLGCQTIVK
jgi:hypothetical protein